MENAKETKNQSFEKIDNVGTPLARLRKRERGRTADHVGIRRRFGPHTPRTALSPRIRPRGGRGSVRPEQPAVERRADWRGGVRAALPADGRSPVRVTLRQQHETPEVRERARRGAGCAGGQVRKSTPCLHTGSGTLGRQLPKSPFCAEAPTQRGLTGRVLQRSLAQGVRWWGRVARRGSRECRRGSHAHTSSGLFWEQQRRGTGAAHPCPRQLLLSPTLETAQKLGAGDRWVQGGTRQDTTERCSVMGRSDWRLAE